MSMGLHVRRLDDSSSSGPSRTLYIIIGASAAVLALLVVLAGVALCRRERRRARALADQAQYVYIAPAPPASQLSPGIAATKAAFPPVAALPPLSARAGAGRGSPPPPELPVYMAVTSPGGAYAAPHSFQELQPGSSGSLEVADPVGAAGPADATLSLSQRSRSNSFDKHASYRRFMYGEEVETEPVPSSSESLWDDPVIVAARVPLDRLELGRVLSRGGFGEVLEGEYKGRKVAVKRLLPSTRRELRAIEGFLAEVRLMAALEHPKVVQFVGVAWDALSDLCAVSEFMDGGDLRALLCAFNGDTGDSRHASGDSSRPLYPPRRQGFDLDKARIALDVAHALTYLHSLDPPVLHRDLKSRNVLLDGELRAKLTDFGVSRERLMTDPSTMTAGVGTLLWMAPEVMMGDRYDQQADLFSLGVLLSELDTQQLPYERARVSDTGRAIPDAAILQLVAGGDLRAHFSRPRTPAMERVTLLGEQCVALEPRDRPSAAEALYQLQLAVREQEALDAEAVDAVGEADEGHSFLF